MNKAIKFIRIFLIISICVIANNESYSQLKYDYKRNQIVKLDNVSKENFSKPRGFKKRRYARSTFFAEGGYFFGYYTGYRFSINYDLLVQSNDNDAFSIRIGYGRNKASNDSTFKGDEKIIPIAAHVMIGNVHHFEIGFGAYYYMDRQMFTPYASLGYRHQKPRGGLMYRVAFDMQLERALNTKGVNINKTVVFGPVAAFGYTF